MRHRITFEVKDEYKDEVIEILKKFTPFIYNREVTIEPILEAAYINVSIDLEPTNQTVHHMEDKSGK
jgi:putative lipoic acid-binding regulatory protein